MSRESSRAAKAAPAAGGGSPGTTNASAAERLTQGELAAEDAAAIAESLTPPGGALADVLAAEADMPAAPMVAAVLVRALPEAGFRRAGRHWPATPVTVAADELSFEQIDALLREPMLHVTLIGEAEGE